MQYNDGNKARLRKEEGESLRVLSSVGDNYNVRNRETDRGEQYAYTWLNRIKLFSDWE